MVVRSSLGFNVLLKLAVSGSNNSATLVLHDGGDVELLSLSSRTLVSHCFAVSFSAALLIWTKMFLLWAGPVLGYGSIPALHAMHASVSAASEAVHVQCAHS